MLDSCAVSDNLVVVESPAKARTIERYLGPGYRVLASYGHVRDLPENPGKGELGVDVKGDFAPEYVIPADRRRHVAAIERAARAAPRVYLATDLDREGEAIAWHVAQAAGIPDEKSARVTFSEITERAVREAFAHPRKIDRALVDAQQARRIVDRLVGYTLSPLVSKKIQSGLSAGRVQSVAVRLVVDREREIRAFVAREYWTIAATLLAPDGTPFEADLVRVDGDKPEIPDAASAEQIAGELLSSRPVVDSVGVRTSKRSPAPPFTTSTLQQEASRQLRFSPKKTMSIAQRLYEGVETPDGQVGLITYMRTDSVHLSGQAIGEARAVISERFGEQYAMPHGRQYRTKQRNAQEAHEAIRPTSFARDPDELARHIGRDEARLYGLIWRRAIASQMREKELETTTVDLAAGRSGLRATATRTIFEGFARVYTEGRDDGADEQERTLPPLAVGDETAVDDVRPVQHFTEPPPRYTEATLVRALEENGIGRPSTYAAILSTIVDRGYVVIRERRLYPTCVAEIVTGFLVDHFGEYVDLQFTARMEEDLDQVARGERAWVPLLRDFYVPLSDQVVEVRRTTRRREVTTVATDEVCSQGHPMVIRLGPTGCFLACSLYPEHSETRPLPGEEAAPLPDLPGVGEPCPECGPTEGGRLAAKRGRFGPFVGCDRYPACSYIKRDGPPPPPPLPFEAVCPSCGTGHLVTRRARRTGRTFWGCSRYPKCDYTTEREPLGPVHDPDGSILARAGDGTAICLGCGATMPLGADDDLAPGRRIAGGTPDPAALARPERRRRPTGGRAPGGRASAGGASGRRSTGGKRGPETPRRGAGRPARPADGS